MHTRDQLLAQVIASTKHIVTENQTGNPETIGVNTPLYGRSGILDSLGLVQLIADLEDEVQNITGRVITIADERAMSIKFSPFRSVSSLTDYIELLLKEYND